MRNHADAPRSSLLLPVPRTPAALRRARCDLHRRPFRAPVHPVARRVRGQEPRPRRHRPGRRRRHLQRRHRRPGRRLGAAANPVVIRWNRAAGTTRPLLQGGQHTIKFEQSNNVVFEGFEVTGGSSTCIFSEADNVTVRDSLIRDCPSHGILGADHNSGSFTLEYSEIYNSGAGTAAIDLHAERRSGLPGCRIPHALQLRAQRYRRRAGARAPERALITTTGSRIRCMARWS